jgi:hypothetical protein
VGGMGLTGIVLACTFRARPVSTSRMLVDTDRTNCLDETVARLMEYDHSRSYSVAWLDVLARGRALGRAVITAGDHAPVEALAVDDLTDALDFAPRTLPAFPDLVPSRLLSSLTVAAFNALWYRRARWPAGHRLSTFQRPPLASPSYSTRSTYLFSTPVDARTWPKAPGSTAQPCRRCIRASGVEAGPGRSRPDRLLPKRSGPPIGSVPDALQLTPRPPTFAGRSSTRQCSAAATRDRTAR